MINGIINIYKETGYTSHDVVAKMRGILKQKKIGHTGTLDPQAEGVLPVCLGAGTKVCDLLTEHDKEYRTVLRLGVVTDTQDMTGQILLESTDLPDEEKVRTVIESFVGAYDQIPPMYSALKVNGKKLYELAREGKTVERKARGVQIYEIRVEDMELLPENRCDRVVMSVKCSKGTYIRTLCHDIGEKLGCGGCMESLLRTKVGNFSLHNAITLAQLQELSQQGKVEEAVIPVDALFDDLPAYHTLPKADKLLHNGNGLDYLPDAVTDPDQTGMIKARIYDSAGIFWGIYQYSPEEHVWKPVKMFPGMS